MFESRQELRERFFDHYHECPYCKPHRLCAPGYKLLLNAIQSVLPHQPSFTDSITPVIENVVTQ